MKSSLRDDDLSEMYTGKFSEPDVNSSSSTNLKKKFLSIHRSNTNPKSKKGIKTLNPKVIDDDDYEDDEAIPIQTNGNFEQWEKKVDANHKETQRPFAATYDQPLTDLVLMQDEKHEGNFGKIR